MGIVFLQSQNTWLVSYSKRNPITRQAVSLRRQTIKDSCGLRNIKSKAEAQRVYNELVIEVEKKVHRKIIPTWQSCIDSYLESAIQRGQSKKTVESYRLCLYAHTIQAWSDRSVDQISSEEIRSLIQTRLSNRSESHKKNMRKFINAVFNYAFESGFILKNPTPEMKFRIGDKIKKVLTEPQARLLLERANELNYEWYPHWVMALYTGMRNGELYALTWDKVNLDERHIYVDCSWNTDDGFKETKSGDDRIVEIAPPLLLVLTELKIKNHDSNFVLPRIDKWDKGEQARELRLFLVGMGLPPIRFHDLRATWATILLTKGVEPIKVMVLGGWKDLKTMQIYIRKAGVNIKGATDNLTLHNPIKNIADVLDLGARRIQS